MGKWTDKLYITHSEWSNKHSEGGLSFGGASGSKPKSQFRRLPFFNCALSLQPFDDPVATREGHVFDRANILQWIKENASINPATGKPLAEADLVPLKFHKNADGAFHCPVTCKVFTDSTHIVAVATSGNVYAHEAVQELNVAPGNWRDLIDDTPFTRRDIIHIQDPTNVDRQNLDAFWYRTHDKAFERRGAPAESINATGLVQRVLDEVATTTFSKIDPTAPEPASSSSSSSAAPAVNAKYQSATKKSTGRTAASFTSTSMDVRTAAEAVLVDDNDFMYDEFCTEIIDARKAAAQLKSKAAKAKVDQGLGYVKLKTSFGDLNIELFCVLAPRTCHNFLLLAAKGYYKNVPFHRLIPKFMIQGGDPTGTGRGGESAWGGNFKDEIRPSMKHNARGLLSMANRGKDTNSSQFFITFAPTPHLDGKHTIFGRVVGGLDVLDKMESVATTAQDKPVAPITILDAQVFVDPFEKWAETYAKRQADAAEQKLSREQRIAKEGTWLGAPAAAPTSADGAKPVIGKYIKQNAAGTAAGSGSMFGPTKRTASAAALPPVSASKKAKTPSGSAGGFDNW
ncbi:cyclophilin peptidyl-prolyl cis-trans isomerase Cyp8 [Blastocladiella emersonii ATCC 22665]|nr:cyclophilin peptidyl-prolyl cis-trans isomerase Cyp8 [Blastocladiella emersonii ATCC 22665]